MAGPITREAPNKERHHVWTEGFRDDADMSHGDRPLKPPPIHHEASRVTKDAWNRETSSHPKAEPIVTHGLS